MARQTASRVIAMWTRAMLDEVAPTWRRALPDLSLVDAAALRGSDPYIAHEDMIALWSHFTDRHADPLFGLHFAQRHAESGVGLYAHAAAHARDFGSGARACLQLQRLIDTHSDIAIVDVDGGIRIRHIPPAGIARWPKHLAESLAGGTLHLGRLFAGVPIVPREAAFQHPDDGRAKATRGWLGCKVKYDQPYNALVFDQATLALPFRHADATHYAAIVSAATRTLDAVAPLAGFVDQVRTALRARAGQRTTLAVLARVLKQSERTVQRRLGEAGVTFRQLADEVRVETLAEQALTPQKGRATAGALGFADPSSVRRLRKRWRKPTTR